MRAPAALASIPFLIGSVVALLLWPAPGAATPVIGAGAAALALLAAAAEDDRAFSCLAVLSGYFLSGLALGWTAADRVYNPSLLEWYAVHGTSEPVTLEGTLREDASAASYGASIAIDVDRVATVPTAGGVRLSITGSLAASALGEWRRGRRVRLPAMLRRPSGYDNPGAPDEVRALARRGICLVGSAKSGALVERLEKGSRLQEAAAAARAWARSQLDAEVRPSSERSAAVATAILIGDRSRLPEDDERRLQEAGTYHVIAISGGNIAIVTVLLMWMGRIVFLPRAVSAAGTIGVLLFYGQMTGPAPSVGRAVTAAVIFLAARLVDHRGPPINALAIAALLSVAASPVAVLDPGFMLSFGATLGILLGTPHLLSPQRHRRGSLVLRGVRSFGRAAAAVLAATTCAELSLGPIGASLFGRVTFAGLLLNFVAIPLMTVVQIAGAVVLAVPETWRSLSAWAARLTHYAAAGLVESARLVELAPWMSVAVNPPSWLLIAIYYTAAMAMLCQRLRRGATACVAATAGVMIVGPPALARGTVPSPRYPLRVVALDVGQGDATLISLPGGGALLVDAGGVASYSQSAGDDVPGFDVGERVVLPALRALGVSRLHALVVTHGDPDHVLGAPAVLRALEVSSVWEGVPVPPHAGLRDLRRQAAVAGIAWRTVQAGDRDRFGEVEVRVLHPPPPDWERQRIRNEDSIVLELRLGRVSIVLAGDVGREGERAILSRLEPGRLAVLKAGHHGSATSSTPELLTVLNPAAVIFSAGRDNRFGHPHPAVVARFDAIGAAIFRTDQDGAVFVETDGTTVQMRGWRGRAVLLTANALARTTTRRHDGTKE